MTLFSTLIAPLLENSTYITVRCREGTRLKYVCLSMLKVLKGQVLLNIYDY